MKYRKKPVVVEAVRYTGENLSDIEEFAAGRGRPVAKSFDGDVVIRTLEGDMIAMPGYWIIKGVRGEIYPCRPDIFAETYEEADKHFADADKMVRWISVEERLPDSDMQVLCYYEYFRYGDYNCMVDEIDRGYFFNGQFGGINGSKLKVKFWMPLPEPPEVQS